MRKTILREGPDYPIGGNVIMPGALKWDPEKRIPIKGPSNESGVGIGYIDDIRREEDGRVTAEFHFFDGYEQHAELIDEADWGWTIYAKQVEWEGKSMSSKKMLDGVLVATYPAPNIPWSIKKDDKK